MITKERLKELIEQGATIYYKEYGKIKDVTLDNSYYIDKFSEVSNMDVLCRGCCDFDDDEFRIIVTFLSELYETEEDAEFVLKYHTFRVEKFEPPLYEDIKDGQPYMFNFTSNGKHYNFFTSVLLIELLEVNDEDSAYSEQIICKHSTKENYIKAVEKARKLFLGESDEN